jgi:hypothetical protein
MELLTKKQITVKMQGFECPKYLKDSCFEPIREQCLMAIDLATENRRLIKKVCGLAEEVKQLKATLAEIERVCDNQYPDGEIFVKTKI